jgi:TRAP-type C4-dicarboxylate transport system permease small subunit
LSSHPSNPPGQPRVRVPLALEDWVSVLVLSALALITFINVIVRYLTSGSFAWTEEISVFLLIILTMVAGSTAFVRMQHIRIEAVADRGTPALAIVSAVVVLGFFMVLTLLSARMAFDDYTWGDTSPAIGIPNWWYTIWMPVLACVITLRVAGMLRRLLRGGA